MQKGCIQIQTVQWCLRPGFCRSIYETKKSFTEHVGQMAKYHNLYAVAKKYYTRRIPKLDVKKYVFHFKVSIISPNIFRTIYNTYLLLNITHETQCSNCSSHIYQLRQVLQTTYFGKTMFCTYSDAAVVRRTYGPHKCHHNKEIMRIFEPCNILY